jgi:hypothetical protein
MVRGMQAPEQPHFMAEEMINEMPEFPDDITINKPVPGKAGFKDGVFFKEAYAKYYQRNGDEPANKSIQQV